MNFTGLNKIKNIFILVIAILFFSNLPAYSVVWDNPKDISVYIPQGDDKSNMMKKAFEEWQNKTNNQFCFKFVNSADKSDINVIFIEKNLESYCGNITSLGCSINYNNHSTIYIAKRRPKGLLLSNTQVYAIMRHEIGHSLGLEHSSNFNSIMYSTTNLGIAIRQNIINEDLQNLYKIYGINSH